MADAVRMMDGTGAIPARVTRPWDDMTAAELVAAIVEGNGPFAFVRGQLKVTLAMPSPSRFVPSDGGAMRPVAPVSAECVHAAVIVDEQAGTGKCCHCGASIEMESIPAFNDLSDRIWWHRSESAKNSPAHPANDPRYVETRSGWWDLR